MQTKKTYNESYRLTAEDTLKQFENGLYKEEVEHSVLNTEYYENYSTFGTKNIDVNGDIQLNVSRETTIEGILRLTKEGSKNIMALNFASQKRPGGGFLKGTVAQEESLARNSSLYLSLVTKPEYYKNPVAPYYSDRMIYSPDVIFIKDDNGDMLDKPVLCNIITCAAPNLRDAVNVDHNKIQDIFYRRIFNILKLAYDNGCENLILGAFGCGVFLNDPVVVARCFRQVIQQEFNDVFESITFSIYDKIGNCINAFKQ